MLVLLLVAQAVGRPQLEAGLLSQSPNSLDVVHKNHVRNLIRRRQTDARKKMKKKQKKISATAGGMRLVAVAHSKAGSVVATWVKANARCQTSQ